MLDATVPEATEASPGLRRAFLSQYWIFTATAVSLLTLILFPWWMRGRTEGYLHPHGYCYLWDSALVSSHVIADLLIGAAYVSISVTLAYLVHRVRHLLPFHWMFLAFGLFILTCGATHFMDVWTLWFADFWASAALKIVTAVASIATAVALPPLIPQVARLLHAANVSEERRARLVDAEREREAVRAESEAKDLFLATLSHELRTPLNVIAGWVHILHRQGADPEVRQRALEVLLRNISVQHRLVEDLLDVSAVITGRLQLNARPVDLRLVVRDAVDLASTEAGGRAQDLDMRLPDTPVTILGDDVRLQQLVGNLLSNAVKFTPAGGRIVITLGREGNEAVLKVTDNGQGIDPDFLPHVFDVFAQADQTSTRASGGLGLGLALVQHLVERHGGSVRASSPGPGQGSTFEVRLPMTADKPMRETAAG